MNPHGVHVPTDRALVECEGCVVPRVLIVPGLRGSGPEHWQSWLQRRYRRSVRARIGDLNRPDLQAWSDDVGRTLAEEAPGPWVAVTHSFGGLALLHHLLNRPLPQPSPRESTPALRAEIVAALVVAPASPRRHGAEAVLAQRPSGVDLWVVSSSDDPWLPTHLALPWAACWGARLHDLGPAGHINVDSGFGRWPQGQAMLQKLLQRWHAQRAAPPHENGAFTLRASPRPAGHLAGI